MALIPDHETAVDFLNYEAIAHTVTGLLKESRDHAITVGIHGDWGAGKSSILKMVEKSVAGDAQIACLWFSGWTFQGFDDAKTVLIEATVKELCRQRPGVNKVKELGTSLLKRIDWLKVMKRGAGLAFTLSTGIPSPDQLGMLASGIQSLRDGAESLSQSDIENGLDQVSALLQPDTNAYVTEQMYHFRKDFTDLLEEAKIDQLIILIDDLDRCLPETAIDTLEAIRLFLFVPHTAFVIGADEAMIEYAVRQHFPELPIGSGPLPYSRNYLEKLVQVPFRIPALGIQETKTYVTLLLVESLVGANHDGFKTLLKTAKGNMNEPWTGVGLQQADLEAVDAERKQELIATFMLAQQIGPILAEGTRGNPRQIKRFLNSILIRQAIAEARGFGDNINRVILAKLMLAERFQPDFYEHLSGKAMIAENGAPEVITALEEKIASDNTTASASESETDNDQSTQTKVDDSLANWLDRAWLVRWLLIDPQLKGSDLRPYVFVARDKRVLMDNPEHNSLEGLITKLCGSEMAVRTAEPAVKELSNLNAQTVFAALRDRVLRQGDFNSQPPGFEGMCIVAKHHQQFQLEIMGMLSSVEPSSLGIWVTKGWNEILSEQNAKVQLQTLISGWASQNENPLLKTTARHAIQTFSSEAN